MKKRMRRKTHKKQRKNQKTLMRRKKKKMRSRRMKILKMKSQLKKKRKKRRKTQNLNSTLEGNQYYLHPRSRFLLKRQSIPLMMKTMMKIKVSSLTMMMKIKVNKLMKKKQKNLSQKKYQKQKVSLKKIVKRTTHLAILRVQILQECLINLETQIMILENIML